MFVWQNEAITVQVSTFVIHYKPQAQIVDAINIPIVLKQTNCRKKRVKSDNLAGVWQGFRFFVCFVNIGCLSWHFASIQ